MVTLPGFQESTLQKGIKHFEENAMKSKTESNIHQGVLIIFTWKGTQIL